MIDNVTIAHNTAHDGGGIYYPSYAVTIENRIVADNTGTASANGGADCYQANASDNAGQADAGGNLDSDGTCFLNGVKGDQAGVNPQLHALADNNGATPTDALLPGSPAIGKGLGPACPSTDQRGIPRPSGSCDSGAYQTVPADLALAASGPSSGRLGQTITDTFTISNNGPAQATEVMFTDTLPAGTSYAGASASQGSCMGTTTVTCSLGVLNAGASATVTVMLTPSQAGSVSNTASVSGAQPDPDPANNMASVTTVVTGHPPVASFTVSPAPTVARPVSFDGAGSKDPNDGGSISSYSWDFGDGTALATGMKVTHTYAEPGTYNVTLTVTDSERVSASTSRAITVTTTGPMPGQVTIGTANASGTAVTVPIQCSGDLKTFPSCQLVLLLIAVGLNPGLTTDGATAATAHSGKHHAKPVVVGTEKVTIRAGHRKTVRITLNRTGRRLLARHHTLKVLLTITQRGHTVLSRTITFKAKPPSKQTHR